MSKTMLNKKERKWERTIKINGISTLLSSKSRTHLELLPYKIGNKDNPIIHKIGGRKRK